MSYESSNKASVVKQSSLRKSKQTQQEVRMHFQKVRLG